MKRETRQVKVAVSVREADSKQYLVGRPVVYNSDSLPIHGYFVERMRPGCFDKCLSRNPDILCLRDHNPDKLLGRTSSKTLTITPDENGIAIECELPRTTYGLDLYESIRRQDINGMSFGFDVLSDDWYMKDGIRYRDVIEADLYEVSFVTMAAYPGTEASVRDFESFKAEAEKRLRVEGSPLLDALRSRLRWRQY